MFSPVISNSILRTTIHFSGHVQGVGFRFTALHVARGYDVTGFVQNLADGRVLLVAEGAADEINGLVEAVSDQMAGYIGKTERVDETGPRRHHGFSLK